MSYIQLVRPFNLFIVFALLYTLQYLIVWPDLSSSGLTPRMGHGAYGLLTLAILLMTAAGYVINDIYDIETDKYNKPHKAIIPEQISIRNAYIFYGVLLFTSFVCSIALCIRFDRIGLIAIYFIFALLLWIYSFKLKKTLFTGNLLVSAICGIGILTPALIETHPVTEGLGFHWIIWAFAGFAFLTTFMREIVKDMEDVYGDLRAGAHTMPVLFGAKRSKQVVTVLGFILLGLTCVWLWAIWQSAPLYSHLVFILVVILPLLYSLLRLAIAREQSAYHNVSQLLKGVMIGALIYLFTI